MLPAGQALAFEAATTGWYAARAVLGGVEESLTVIAKLNGPAVVGVPVIVTVFVVVVIMIVGLVLVPPLKDNPGGREGPAVIFHV